MVREGDRGNHLIPRELRANPTPGDGRGTIWVVEHVVDLVWTGGWADVGHLIDGEVYSFSPGFSDVGGAYGAVVKAVEDFLA